MIDFILRLLGIRPWVAYEDSTDKAIKRVIAAQDGEFVSVTRDALTNLKFVRSVIVRDMMESNYRLRRQGLRFRVSQLLAVAIGRCAEQRDENLGYRKPAGDRLLIAGLPVVADPSLTIDHYAIDTGGDYTYYYTCPIARERYGKEAEAG